MLRNQLRRCRTYQRIIRIRHPYFHNTCFLKVDLNLQFLEGKLRSRTKQSERDAVYAILIFLSAGKKEARTHILMRGRTPGTPGLTT